MDPPIHGKEGATSSAVAIFVNAYLEGKDLTSLINYEHKGVYQSIELSSIRGTLCSITVGVFGHDMRGQKG